MIEALDRYRATSDTNYGYYCDDHCNSEYQLNVLKPYIDRLKSKTQVPLVLDLASGSGDVSTYLESEGLNVIALDLSRGGLESHNSKRVRGLFDELPFKGGTFDSIHFKDALVHSSNKTKLLKEAWRVLKPGGEMLIISKPQTLPIPHFPFREGGVSTVGFFFSEKHHQMMVRNIEANLKESDYVGPPYYLTLKILTEIVARNVGFEIRDLGKWEPSESMDWYTNNTKLGFTRFVLSLVKPESTKSRLK